ncbi:SLBB domain-containing protein [Polynucleobacter sinensis]|uniref:SLBB domain-containing protein n=1 Tax=Polynucleobacter sinensis TaxID=1743157 RepID=UPI000781FB9E|nr:SLBB domain-containing protein [Polynucleobacter sinensis]
MVTTGLVFAQIDPSAASGDGSMFGGALGGGRPTTQTQNLGPAILGGTSALDRAAIRETIANGSSQQAEKPTDINGEPSEFQKYVQEKVGSIVPNFGANFFEKAPTTFAPALNIPVPADYEFGPGDEVIIRAWGGANIDYRAVIDRNGIISIPAVGTIPLSGIKASQAEGVIRNAIGKSFSNVQVSVTPGQIRAIRVYVVGQAQKPGAYTVSSLSTLITAIFATGGPSTTGSMRNVELKRGGRTVTKVDLYSFIAKGDKKEDVQLQEGDTIVFPPIFGQVAIIGAVETPAIYELKNDSETIGSLISLIGGLPVTSDPQTATLQRLDPTSKPAAIQQSVSLDQSGQKMAWMRGDILTVIGISTAVPMAKRNILVRIDGEVNKPGIYQMKYGQTTQDLIEKAGGPTPQAYIFATSFYRNSTRVQQVDAYKRLLLRMEASVKSQAATLSQNMSGGVGTEAAILAQRNQAALAAAQGQIARLKQLKPEGRIALNINPNADSVEAIPDLPLEPGDRLSIPAMSDFVQVYGSVNIESSLLYKPSATVSDYLKLSGTQKEADMDAIFMLRADGTVLSDDGSYFSSIMGQKVNPGDTIVVPEKLDRETKYSAFMRGLKDWSMILGQLGLAAAAIHVLAN